MSASAERAEGGEEEEEDVEENIEDEDEDFFQDEGAVDSFHELPTRNGRRAPHGHFECTQDSFNRSMPPQRDDPGASLLPPLALARASLYDLDRSGRRGSVFPRNSRRRDHLMSLVLEQHNKLLLINHMLEDSNLSEIDVDSNISGDMEHHDSVEIKIDSRLPPEITDSTTDKLIAQLECIKRYEKISKKTKELFFDTNFQFPIEVRLKNLTYTVPVPTDPSKIRTVYNSSVLYQLIKFFKRLREGKLFAAYTKKKSISNSGSRQRVVLDSINLILKPGRMYLVLGAPGSGKTSLLRAIASRLQEGKKKGKIEGEITYNGTKLKVCN
jgi:hypothetical protein